MNFKLLAVLSGLLLLASCSKPDDAIELPDQPKGYQELLSAYNSGYTYLKTIAENGTTTVVFQEKSLTVNDKELKIHDHTKTELPRIGLSKESGMWSMNGQLNGIKFHSTLTNEQACPVYVWFDKETLHMIISNETYLDYKFVPKEPLPEPRKFKLPAVYITTEGKAPIVSKDDYVNGSLRVTDQDGTYSAELEFEASGKFKGRGNSTWGMPKKPYRIKLDSKASLLGMPSSKNWALLANYADKSLVRNKTAMLISKMLGMSWTPKMTPVELYINGEYQGLYDLCEHKETGTNKVNINVVDKKATSPEDIEGDYYLEIDENMDETVCFWTSKRVPIMFSDPETPNKEQQDYIKNYLNSFEAALFGNDFKDSAKGYAAWIDVDSFINNYIIQELSKNVDGNTRRSTYLTKEKGKKLILYHVWDFDLAFGNADYFDGAVGNGPTGWWVKDYGPFGKRSGWYYRMFEDPAFKQKLKARWEEVFPQLERIPEYIDLMVSEMQDGPAKNFSKWNILNKYVWPNVVVTGSYSKEIDYLKNYYTDRLNWLDTQIRSL